MRRVKATAAAAAGTLLAASFLVLVALGIGPRTGAYRTLTVLSDSMAPGIPAGALVVVTPVAASSVRRGDVITFNIPVGDRRVVTHRVVEVIEGGDHPVLRTKGDGNAAPDPWTPRIEEPVVWRVSATVPGAGHAIKWLRTPAVRTASVLIAPALLALLWLADVWRPERGGLAVHG